MARGRPGPRPSAKGLRARLAALVCALLSIPCPVAQAAEPFADTRILSPLDGDQIPRAGIDPPCVGGYCLEVHVRGRVSEGYWPFLAGSGRRPRTPASGSRI